MIEKNEKAILEINVLETEVTFNMVFLNTGEIRPKTRSKEWLMKRVFQSELRTAKKKYGETVEYDND